LSDTRSRNRTWRRCTASCSTALRKVHGRRHSHARSYPWYSAYPEDDQLEYQLQVEQGRYNEIQGYLNRESQALNLLMAANGTLQACDAKMHEALNYSQWGTRS
jgi:hypothetical protein